MNCTATNLSFEETGFFSKIIIDYLNNADELKPFYTYPVSTDGIKAAIRAREQFRTNRKVLVEQLSEQYSNVQSNAAVLANINKLSGENTFTVTTAHQPAIFTGTLYFIYKIVHAIKLAAELKKELPQYDFVPVYFMGSEDADLDELGNIYLDNEKITWDTRQKGAVGRMSPKGLEKIIERVEGEFSVEAFGKELAELLKDSYLRSPDIQTGTFNLVHKLFSDYGLIVFIPDNGAYKKEMIPVFEDDLLHQTASGIVEQTITELSKHYKVQATPRAINLFYLENSLRGRIDLVNDKYIVHDSDLQFSEKEIMHELKKHPEKFSPNVILRGLFQETILPNIVFIGGGGETAYWLELKKLFGHYHVPYPMLVVRNSFLIIEKKWKEKANKIGMSVRDLFVPEEKLITDFVKSNSQNQLELKKEIGGIEAYYDELKTIAQKVDITLSQHTEALKARSLKLLHQLEKKLLRAEKRKYEEQRKKIHAVKSALFPLNSLQERIENFMPYYAKWGKEFIDVLYKHSPSLEQQFVVLSEE